jgi:hypothetical protein
VSVDLPGANNASVFTPDQLVAGNETTLINRKAPITHGAGVSNVLDDDNELYDACRTGLFETLFEDLQPDEKAAIPADIDFNDGEHVWLFSSSGYKAGAVNSHGNWKQWYKYHLMLRKVDSRDENGEIDEVSKPPTSVHVLVEPQKSGMTYDPEDNDGELEEVDLPYGEGTRISVQTAYVERPSQVVRRAFDGLQDALRHVDQDNLVDAGQIKQESSRIWKLESHVRFDISRKNALIKTIEQSESLVDFGGGAEIQTWKERKQEGWMEARVESDRWQWLGLQPATTTVVEDGEEKQEIYQQEIKVYQANDWHEKSPDHYAHHPKAEASLGKGHNPHISEWNTVLDRLRETVCSHLEWAGVEDTDLVADPFFKPKDQPSFEYEHPEGRREDLREYFDAFDAVIYGQCDHESQAVYDILSVITENYGATYEQLVAETGYSRSNIDYHVANLKEIGLCDTSGNPAIVGFATQKIMEIAEDAIKDVASRFEEETIGKQRIERQKRADERERKREEGEANGTEDRDDPRERDEHDRGGDEDDEPRPFRYLEKWNGTPQMMMDELLDSDHERGEKDIRVRILDDTDEPT